MPDNYPVQAGDVIAATRIVPLYISEELLAKAEDIGRKGIVRVLPFQRMKEGLVVTGTEVASGRIPDASSRVEEKLGIRARGHREKARRGTMSDSSGTRSSDF